MSSLQRLLAEGAESAEETASDYQREAAEKDREYDSTASALEGKRELNVEETARLRQLWKKLVRMFHPDLHEHDPEKRKTYELLTQAINEARDEEKGRHRSAGTHRQGPAGVHPETRLGQRFARRRARIDGAAVALWAPSETASERDAPEHGLRRDAAATEDESVIGRIVAEQRVELEREVGGLKVEAERIAGEARELAGEVPF